jgi:S-adenosylmethionine-diacylglycerol 3-amino-3-carboxypropyl transferase
MRWPATNRWRCVLPAAGKLACGFAINDNFSPGRPFRAGTARRRNVRCHPTCRKNWQTPCAKRAERVTVRHANMTEHLARQDALARRYVLLDAQDWMTDGQLNALWQEITTARPARACCSAPPRHPACCRAVAMTLLARWRYHDALSLDLTTRDRSSIYGGVHLYELA